MYNKEYLDELVAEGYPLMEAVQLAKQYAKKRKKIEKKSKKELLGKKASNVEYVWRRYGKNSIA